MSSTHSRIALPVCRGYTLAELMLSLIIFALVASASGSLLYSALNSGSYVQATTTGISAADLALDRVVENVRSASWAQSPQTNQLYLKTQPDPANGNQPDTLEYTVNSGGALIETDTAYGSTPMVLANNVKTFSVQQLQTLPTMFRVTLVVAPPDGSIITRNCDITCRNF